MTGIKDIARLGILVLAAGLLSGSVSARQEEDPLVIKARAFIAALEKSDFVLAARDFDETMMRLSGPEKLAVFWKQVPNQFGPFVKQTSARRDQLGTYDIVLVTCEFAKVTLDARVAFDKSGRIAGFHFVPSVPPAKYEPPAYADPSLFSESDVTVGTGEWKLPGTLTLPKGRGPFPAVVLVHGSGPNDRDETLGPNKPFKDLAWGLASSGIAVLRYDKRSFVYGPKIAAAAKAGTPFTVKDESIDDALAAVELLKKTPGIDVERIFVLGHSLGGFLMPRIAVAGKASGIDGFIIMAGLTRPMDETILRQMKYLFALSGGGTLTEEQKNELAEIEQSVAKVRALKESDRTSGFQYFNAPASYWLDLRGYDPAELAKSVHRPMLILQGQRDYQVTVDDFENWKKALGGREDVTFHLYPRLNHLFIEGKGIPNPDEYTQTHGSVAPEVVKDIADWIKAH